MARDKASPTNLGGNLLLLAHRWTTISSGANADGIDLVLAVEPSACSLWDTAGLSFFPACSGKNQVLLIVAMA